MLLVTYWVERRAHQSQTDESNELNSLADTLIDGVSGKANIVECDLEPGRPEDTEEPNVCEQVVGI